MKDPRLLQGIGVSPGTAIGPAYVIPWGLPDVPHRVVPKKNVPGEIERLHEALDAVKQRLQTLRTHAAEQAGHTEAQIFDAQILMLEDTEFIGPVERLIKDNQLSAERAFEFKVLEVRALWAQSGSQMLRQRRADLAGIGIRVLQRLMGQSIEDVLGPRGGAPAILFTRELTPGLTVEFAQEHVAGFASAEGTSTSHAAILAHSLGIPCVMGLVEGLESVRPHGMVILDGTRGTILTDPSPEEIAEADLEAERRTQLDEELARVGTQPAATVDNVPVSLRCNIDLPEEVGSAVEQGAEGVGLLRTEFLVVGRAELPGEEEQAEYFTDIARRFAGAPGGDSHLRPGGGQIPGTLPAAAGGEPVPGVAGDPRVPRRA